METSWIIKKEINGITSYFGSNQTTSKLEFMSNPMSALHYYNEFLAYDMIREIKENFEFEGELSV